MDKEAAQPNAVHPIASRGRAALFGLVTGAYYVAAGILATLATWASLTTVPALMTGRSEYSRGWPQLLLVWIVAVAFGTCGWLFVRRKRLGYCAFVAGIMMLLFPIGTAIGFATIWGIRQGARPTGNEKRLNPYLVALAGGGTGLLLILVASLIDYMLK